MAVIYVSYGMDGNRMAYELMQQADIAARLRPDMNVVLKPNLVVAQGAENGATTHPEIAEGVIRYLKDSGIRSITVAEGAWVGDNTRSAFRACGYEALKKKYGIELVDTKSDGVVSTTSQGYQLTLCRTPLEADYLINLPVLKAHCQTDITCCLKNLKGCIPDSEKRRFHSTGLHHPIAALSAALRPQLHIVDSICGDLTFEEGGNPVQSNRLMLGFDPVLLDSYGATLIGYRPEEVEHIRLAREYGAGQFYSEETAVLELHADRKPVVTQQHSRIARRLAEYVEEDGACSACYAALMFALNRTGGQGGKDRIKIGQGFRGRSCPGRGVGNCASGCDAYVAGCPPKAVDIVDFLYRQGRR